MTPTAFDLPVGRGHLDRVAVLHEEFVAAEPFPLVVLDDFLDAGLAAALVEEFPRLEDMPRSRDYVFGNKHELSSLGRSGPAGRRFESAVLSPPFSEFLSALCGHPVFVDPAFHGGGFHQGGDGSFLDMHVDFNIHPLHADWLRTLNVLVYMTPDWRVEWGGELLVRSRPDAQPRAIEPRYNRCVIMLSAETTYHGYRRMSLPPGVTRRSIATYAYRPVGDQAVVAHTTGWTPEGAGLAKRLLARHYDRLVRTKNRLLGSGTARNR